MFLYLIKHSSYRNTWLEVVVTYFKLLS